LTAAKPEGQNIHITSGNLELECLVTNKY